MSSSTSENEIRAQYLSALGSIPEAVDVRFELYRTAGRNEIFEIEATRSTALAPHGCDPLTVQLVQYALAGAIRSGDGAVVHANAAVNAGATLDQLLDIAQTVLVVCGIPSFNVCCVAAADAVRVSSEDGANLHE